MNSRLQRFVGLGLLIGVILIVVGVQAQRGGTPSEPIAVRGVIGGEKVGFLESEPVRRLLQDKYGLRVDFAKAGSLDLVRGDLSGQDFLWPGSDVQLEQYRQLHGPSAKAETIFNSPIVLYAWSEVTDALIAAGIVEQIDGVYYATDLAGFVAMIDEGQPWSDVGLPLYGGMAIFTTDPTRSNSGNQFAALLANTLNGGQVVDAATVDSVLPTLLRFYERLGFLEDSSGDLFRAFLTTGVGAKPIIAGYESQLIEFSLVNAQYRELLKERIDIIYPRPTVWSSHPLIALTPNGERLLEALKDPEIQRLAWEQHGFRSGLIGIENDPKVLDLGGIPSTITSVVPMPKPAVMDRIVAALSATPGSGAATPSTVAGFVASGLAASFGPVMLLCCPVRRSRMGRGHESTPDAPIAAPAIGASDTARRR